jgi:hypothetical protein
LQNLENTPLPSTTITPSAVAAARNAGYGDSEIIGFLSEKHPEQFKEARDAGYSDTEILSHLAGDAEKPSGIVAGLKQGLANAVHGPAETLKTFGGVDTAALESKAQELAPKDYKHAPVVPEDGHWYDPTSYNWKNVPQALAENAPQMAESIAAAKLGAKIHPLVGLAAGAVPFALNALGDTAKSAAVTRTGDTTAEANTTDKLRAAGTVAAQSIPQMLGVSRFLPGAGKLTTVGGKGVTQAIGQGITTAGVEGAAGAAQNAIGQAGLTVGTDKGLTVDPNEVANAGVTNGILGGAFSTPKMLANASAARKYANFGGDNEAATKAFANRTSDAADGANLSNPKNGYNAVRSAHEDVQTELKTAARSLSNTSVETAAALRRAQKGRVLTDADLNEIDTNTTPDVAALARQAHVGAMLKEQGDFGGGKFVGGIANAVGKHIRVPNTAVAAGLGAAFGGGHAAPLFAYSPETIAALGTAWAAMRGTDALTGNRSPANSFVNRFADPNTPIRSAAPQASQVPSNPTGPSVAPPSPPAQPWGPSLTQQRVNPTGPTVMPPTAPARPWGPALPPLSSLPTLQPRGSSGQSSPLLNALNARNAIQPAAGSASGDSNTTQGPNIGANASALLGAANALKRLTTPPVSDTAAVKPDTQAPVIERITKSGGGDVAEKASPTARSREPDHLEPHETFDPETGEIIAGPQPTSGGPKYSGAYVPLKDHELYGKGMSHSQFAEHELATKNVHDVEAYKDGIARDRQKREMTLQELARNHADSLDDVPIAKALLEQLHHIRRGETAAKAINHYASFMSPKMRGAVLKRLDSSFVNSMWRN